MKNMIFFVLLLVIAVGCQQGQTQTNSTGNGSAGNEANQVRRDNHTQVTFEKIPASVEEFVAMRDKMFSEEISEFEGSARGAALFVMAAHIYSNIDENLGLQCLVVALAPSELSGGLGEGSYKKKVVSPINRQRFESRLKKAPHIARSYFSETAPANKYEVKAPYVVSLHDNRFSIVKENGGKITKYKVFVFSTGADTTRPITLTVNNRGVWKASEYSSLTVGIRAPMEQVDDDI